MPSCASHNLVLLAVDPNHANDAGLSALMAAASRGSTEMTELLLESSADIDLQASNNGATAFHYACGMGHAEVVELLVHQGCSTHLPCKEGETGRQWAESAGQRGVIARLNVI